MRIRKVSIHNFRSIRDIELFCQPLQIFLGPNNHGKSNILAAIEFALSTSAKPFADDFFIFRKAGEAELWVDLEFAELTEQEKTTFRKYVSGNDTVEIRKVARLKEDETVEVSYHGYVSEPMEWWLKSNAVERLSNRSQAESEAEQIPQLRPLLAEKGRLTSQKIEQFQAAFINENRAVLTFTRTLEEGPLLGTKNVGGGALSDFYVVPAVRDLSDEIKVKATTTFGRLLQRAIQEMAARDPRFADLRGRLEALIQTLNTREEGGVDGRPDQLLKIEEAVTQELRPWGVRVSIEVTPPDIEQVFELGTRLHLDDGIKTPAEMKGHGLQRAVMFALLRAWASALRTISGGSSSTVPRKASESIIFAIEEPELFLHPHAQKRLATALKDIAEAPEHQVIICTHSPHFIDLNYHKSIAIISKRDCRIGSTMRQCREELFTGDDAHDRKQRFQIAAWVNPDRGELFFAKKVVLVEGDTEAVILPFLADRLGCIDSEISVINCGSKFNLPLYFNLLKAFQIPYIVLHDEDPLPDPLPGEWNEDKIREKRRTFELNVTIGRLTEGPLGAIHVFSPDFERCSGISATAGERKGKPLAALDHFKAIDAEQIPVRVREIVAAAYREPI